MFSLGSPSVCGDLIASLVHTGSGPLAEHILYGPQIIHRAGCNPRHAARKRERDTHTHKAKPGKALRTKGETSKT